ncbi:hypothetical protein ZIOFF_021267 [Zingiber officinale]|uniref:Uncharacterized protein n=1 Tax=Zingiber officinale TaxID=94328 RepID=A0A8J5H3L1_ZINOF|nr:hypothetical protein ZIOFF_021267 [Zingiber officinale]
MVGSGGEGIDIDNSGANSDNAGASSRDEEEVDRGCRLTGDGQKGEESMSRLWRGRLPALGRQWRRPDGIGAGTTDEKRERDLERRLLVLKEWDRACFGDLGGASALFSCARDDEDPKHEAARKRERRTFFALFSSGIRARGDRIGAREGVAMRGTKRPIHEVATWVKRQPPKVKAFLCVVAGMAALVFLRFIVHDHDNLFVAAEAVHALGISVLIYKLTKGRTCAGARPLSPFHVVVVFFSFSINRATVCLISCSCRLSLKSQDLTALFLAARLYCSLVMEYDIHTVLDTATLATTLWVIYMIRIRLRTSYMEDKDNFAISYVVRHLSRLWKF